MHPTWPIVLSVEKQLAVRAKTIINETRK